MKMLIAALVLVLAGPLAAQDVARRIIVTGEGRVEAAPDMATVTLGVVSEGDTAAEAMTGNSAALSAVLDELARAGIEKRDVQTAGLSLNPRWSNSNASLSGRPEIIGFVATNTVRVRVRDLSALGGVLDAVVKSGANSFQGLQFGLQEPEPLLDEARKRAVQMAIGKARTLTGAAGLELGPVVTISEAGSAAPRPVMMRMDRAETMAASAVPVAGGGLAVHASVTIEFEIGG